MLEDRRMLATDLVSMADPLFPDANFDSSKPSISADGRFVSYLSFASNLVAGDTNGEFDVFLWDRETATTTRVSVSSAGNEANNSSFNPAISADGRFVTYLSFASNLVAGDTNGTFDIFVVDRDTNTTTRVSVDSAGNEANNSSFNPAISADGRFVTYQSTASNLVAGDTNSATDIFVRDRYYRTTTRVNVDSVGTEANSGAYTAAVSADGRYVTYESTASNLVDWDTNGARDIFVSEVPSTAPLAGVDFGDAPDSYQSLIASFGASHANSGPQLGFLRDTETDGQPSVNAITDAADEDGVTFATFVVGQFANVTIEMTGGPAFIDAWVDFNADGDWDDAGEQIFVNASVNDGWQTLPFAVPETATLGNTYTRFRLSTNGGLASSGFADDGEIEDYQVTITQTLEVELPAGNGTDDVTVRLNSGNVEVYDNNGESVIASSPLAYTHAVIVNGAAAEDNKVTVDYQTGGFFSLLGGIDFNGGTSGTDELVIQGSGATVAGYLSNETSLGNASVLTSEGGQQNLVEFSNVEPLSALGMLTFSADGSVYVGANSLTVDAISQLGLDSLTTLTGGTIVAASGVSLGNGQLISGNGQINGPIASTFGSTINLTGNLTLGDAASAAGFASDGQLDIGANTATINDANEAVLGSLTTLGTAAADGTLNAPNGAFLEEGKNLQGRGTVQGDFHNDGHVISTNDIIFNGLVNGIGDFSGTVTFNGGTSFGHSPTQTEINGNANFGNSNTHTVELGGNAAGSEYDQISSTGTVHLDGTLDVRLINSFTPQAGDSFEILNAANGINGAFNTVNLPTLANILEWEIVTETNTITLSITYSADMIAMFDMALVTTPTTTNADGSVASVPTSMSEIHEWQGYFIEIYAQVPAGVEDVLTDVEFTLNYDNTQINFDLSGIEAGGGLATFSTSGPVGQLMISGTLDDSHPDLGIGSPFLVARIPASSAVVANVSGAYPVESNATLPTMSDSQVVIDQFTTPVDGADAATATTTIKAVRYDINDDDRVGLVDLSMLVNAFGKSTTNNDLAFRSDFDKNGSVGLTDLSRLVNHFGYSQSDNHTIVFPIVVNPEPVDFLLEGRPVVQESIASPFVVAEPIFNTHQAQPDLQDKTFTTTPLLEAEPIRSIENAITGLESLATPYELDALWSTEYEQLTEDERLLESAAVSEETSRLLIEEKGQKENADDIFAQWGLES